MAEGLTLSNAIILSFIGGLVPAVIWLFFWLQEDKIHPEPNAVITLAFFAGMASVLIALPLELIASKYIPAGLIRIAVWALIEELVKYWAASYSAFKHNVSFDEPVDSMIYLITAALGFSAAENAFFIFGAIQDFPATVTIISGSMRFIGASLLHVLSSATVGIAMAYSFYRSKFVKDEHLIFGIIIAAALHTAFNFFILLFENQNIAMYSLSVFGFVWLGIIAVIFFFEKVKAEIKQ